MPIPRSPFIPEHFDKSPVCKCSHMSEKDHKDYHTTMAVKSSGNESFRHAVNLYELRYKGYVDYNRSKNSHYQYLMRLESSLESAKNGSHNALKNFLSYSEHYKP